MKYRENLCSSLAEIALDISARTLLFGEKKLRMIWPVRDAMRGEKKYLIVKGLSRCTPLEINISAGLSSCLRAHEENAPAGAAYLM